MITRRRRTRAVLVLGILAGLAHAVETITFAPEQIGIASDVYRYAALNALEGGDVYGTAPPDHAGYYFLYPPIVALAFVPHALLGTGTGAFALQTAINLAVSVGTAVVLWRAVARRGIQLTRVDRGLILSFVVLSIYSIIQLVNGQTTLWLAFGLAVGFDALERDREHLAGVAFAGAAVVKLFPAVVGLWLIRTRSSRAVAVATGTGLGALAVGTLAFGPDLTHQYFTDVLVGRYLETTFDGQTAPERSIVTARRQVVALFGIGPPLLTAITAGILLPFVLVTYRRIDTDEQRLAAILATLVATLLFFPFQPLYFSILLYPLVVLLYRLPQGRSRRLLVAGTLLTYVFIGYQVVARLVLSLPVETAVESVLLDLAAATFSFILPPTVGMWLLLAACLSIHIEFDGEMSQPGATPS